ncbi:MAG: lytic transglycosylase domain-containing protein [Burkholderiaceae bacterium]|nr:lytic transglycosylase domain-containing protein [Pseudomonadota bacterium]MBS0597349.1 lytic transglycosylase domain-containing protein [Pseudomonadota bacterium]MCO5115568.1 lytic transglycosylase domain-containing protein [Burkholderiaceae bacterium]MCP5218049.1 lytic transglycosylase domain-containing protein [Burkholderiaceae bacterium]
MTASGRLAAVGSGLKTFAGDVAEGLFEITHNSLALLGVVTVLAVALLGTRPELRQQGEDRLADWLQARKVATLDIAPEPEAIDRATATDPKALPREQASVAQWIARKYHVAPEPVAALVAEAYDVGRASKLDPTLILAVMAVESSFNPFAQSAVGAQGLMQVMTDVHADKYQHFGGSYAAFDPKTNLRVGVKVLQECIARAGSLLGGLKYYVGAANLAGDGGYADKVMAEYARLHRVATGKPLPAQPPVVQPPASPPPAADGADLRAANSATTPSVVAKLAS